MSEQKTRPTCNKNIKHRLKVNELEVVTTLNNKKGNDVKETFTRTLVNNSRTSQDFQSFEVLHCVYGASDTNYTIDIIPNFRLKPMLKSMLYD